MHSVKGLHIMTALKKLAFISLGVLLVPLIVLARIITFGTSPPPPPMTSVAAPFRSVDYSDMPPLTTYPARDGAPLAFRFYPGNPARIVVIVHGSSSNGASLHPMAKAAQAEGFTTYTMDIRGHGASGMKGDIAYNGQLDDDLADFVAYLRQQTPDATLQLAGFSSGGAFALRTAGGSNGDLFDRYVLVSPALPYNAPTMRPNAGGWVQPFIPRIVGLTILDRFGIHTFEHLPVLAFAVDPLSSANPTASYSYRLQQNYSAHADFSADIRNIRKPTRLLVGAEDDLLIADAFAPLFGVERSDIPIKIIPGLGHTEMSVMPEALSAFVEALGE
jgi:non-heme chloroperoxidase